MLLCAQYMLQSLLDQYELLRNKLKLAEILTLDPKPHNQNLVSLNGFYTNLYNLIYIFTWLHGSSSFMFSLFLLPALESTIGSLVSVSSWKAGDGSRPVQSNLEVRVDGSLSPSNVAVFLETQTSIVLDSRMSSYVKLRFSLSSLFLTQIYSGLLWSLIWLCC